MSPVSTKSNRNKSKKSGNSGSSKANWVIKVFLLAFGLSIFFSLISETLMVKVNIWVSLLILFFIIAIGVLFDIIGISVTSASEAPFHAMASDKVPGSKEAVKLIRNADIVSNFCNDIVGDICGIVSGAAGAAIASKFNKFLNIDEPWLSTLMVGIISTLTIGGKAIGKGIALDYSKDVVFNVAKLLFLIKKHLGIKPLNDKNKKR